MVFWSILTKIFQCRQGTRIFLYIIRDNQSRTRCNGFTRDCRQRSHHTTGITVLKDLLNLWGALTVDVRRVGIFPPAKFPDNPSFSNLPCPTQDKRLPSNPILPIKQIIIYQSFHNIILHFFWTKSQCKDTFFLTNDGRNNTFFRTTNGAKTTFFRTNGMPRQIKKRVCTSVCKPSLYIFDSINPKPQSGL